MLPARFPNLLVNGSQGIAVGMATNIPPHNLGEVIDATIHLIDHPEATPDDLMQFVKGPDFPTGAQHPRPGRHHRRLPHRPGQREDAGHGHDRGGARTGAMQIVVTELPYQTSCSAIAGRIQELVDAGDLEGIADVNDDSAGGKTSLVITLKRDANANVVLNNLFKLTQLQTRSSINMVALVDGVPRTLNLAQALQGYVDHQVDVITRRSEFRLDKADGTGAHPRGPDQGAQRDRRDHRPHPRQRRRRRRQGRPDGRRRSSSPRSRRSTSSTCSCASSPGCRRIDLETELAETQRDDRRARGDPRRRRCCCAASSRTSWPPSARSSPRRGSARSPSTRARCRSRTSSTTRSSSS